MLDEMTLWIGRSRQVTLAIGRLCKVTLNDFLKLPVLCQIMLRGICDRLLS
jgi:hypothetical protein